MAACKQLLNPTEHQEEEKSDSEHTLSEEDRLLEQLSNLKLEVDGEVIHANKAFLSFHSPVWRSMLSSDFKEKNSSSIPLPGKSVEGMKEFVMVTHLGAKVSIDNIYELLPIFHEYQCQKLLEICDQMLCTQMFSGQNLIVSSKYSLPRSQVKFTARAAKLSLQELRKVDGFDELPHYIVSELVEEMLQQNERTVHTLKQELLQLRPYKEKMDKILIGLHENIWEHSLFCQDAFYYSRLCQCYKKTCDHYNDKIYRAITSSKEPYVLGEARKHFYCSDSCTSCSQYVLWHICECLNNK